MPRPRYPFQQAPTISARDLAAIRWQQEQQEQANQAGWNQAYMNTPGAMVSGLEGMGGGMLSRLAGVRGGIPGMRRAPSLSQRSGVINSLGNLRKWAEESGRQDLLSRVDRLTEKQLAAIEEDESGDFDGGGAPSWMSGFTDSLGALERTFGEE